jgi:hypothetical protein
MKPDHSNDNGMKVGDTVAWLAYGWIRVPVVIEKKDGSGMTRHAEVRLLDPKSLRSKRWAIHPATDWDNRLQVSINRLEPL